MLRFHHDHLWQAMSEFRLLLLPRHCRKNPAERCSRRLPSAGIASLALCRLCTRQWRPWSRLARSYPQVRSSAGKLPPEVEVRAKFSTVGPTPGRSEMDAPIWCDLAVDISVTGSATGHRTDRNAPIHLLPGGIANFVPQIIVSLWSSPSLNPSTIGPRGRYRVVAVVIRMTGSAW